MNSNPGNLRSRQKRFLGEQDAGPKIPNITTYTPPIDKNLTKFVFPLLVCFRIINALCVKTFFQPDEYFQSLEPAWRMAFGNQSGAWITWVGIKTPPGCTKPRHILKAYRNGNTSCDHLCIQQFLLPSIWPLKSSWRAWQSFRNPKQHS